MSVARLDAVVKRYGAVTALADVTLVLEPASTTALLGPNGAGKSTLAALVLGLRRPDRGCVRVLGRDPRDWRARVAVGAALQELAFPQTLRVGEIADLVVRHFPDAPSPDAVLERFDLAGVLRRQVGALSVGQRRRVGVALAFVGRPSLVVLDEPTAGLDADGRRALRGAVDGARAAGAAVLLATHDLDEAEAVATRVVALDSGRVVADGAVDEVKAAAGIVRIRFRAGAAPPVDGARLRGGWAVIETRDAGEAVARLVRLGVPLRDLEVRRLPLEEALGVLTGRR